jgi:hypothetical protein
LARSDQPDHIDLLYVHPAVAGRGVGTMLIDAFEKLANARGRQENASISSTPRCATARRRPASTSRSRTRSRSPACSTARHRLCRGRLSRRQPDRHEFFAEKRTKRADLHRLRHDQAAGRSAVERSGPRALLDAKADAICFVAKAWDYHVRGRARDHAGGEPRLASATASRRAAAGREVLVDCEHFFDGYKANPDYALACAKAAYEAGARWVVLCDTNGGTLPHEVEAIVARWRGRPRRPPRHPRPQRHRQAVANSLAAVRAGARQIQGTLNGIGERCGNANLVSIIPTLKLKPSLRRALRDRRHRRGSWRAAMSRARFDELLNRAPNRRRPMSARAPSPPRPASTPRRS